jgi:Ser/Thr protein kinase RdoA (MazF antagonist)
LTLVSCKFKSARIIDGRWTTVSRLKVEDEQGGHRDVLVRGALLPPDVHAPPPGSNGESFASDGWRCYLPDLRQDISVEPPDQGLPALEVLTDPQRSRALLESALRESGAGLADLELADCRPTVMRYRAGRRCTIRYELEYAPERQRPDWPTAIVAKVYAGDDEGHVTYDGMKAMWASPLRTSTAVAIAEPLALLPEFNVVVQRVVPGEHSLKQHLKTWFAPGLAAGIEALSSPVRKAGRGLAELHASEAPGGPIVTWEAQLAAVRSASEELTSVVPALAGAMEPLASNLEALARNVPAGPLVATHRSFRPAQILVDHDDIAFIDFDGFCQAEAGLDLALFRTTLCDLSLRALTLDDTRPMDPAEHQACVIALDELCVTFLAGYEEVGEVSRSRLALWDALTSAKDILDCWRKVKFEHLERRMVFLQRRLGIEHRLHGIEPAA